MRKKNEYTNERYAELYDFSSSCFMALSAHGEILELNLSSSQLLEYERTHLINSQFGNFVTDDTKQVYNSFLANVFKDKSKEVCEVKLADNRGLSKIVQLTGIVTGNGEQCKIIMFDMTERNMATQALAESKEKYKDLFENTLLGILVIDRDGTFRMANKTAANQFGLPTEEVVGKSLFDLMPPESGQKYFKLNRALMETGGQRQYEDSFWMHGEQKTFAIFDKCLHDTDGVIYAIQSTSIDITQQKQASRALEESEMKLKTIFELLPVGVSVLDADRHVVYANPALERILGLTQTDLMHGNYRDRTYLRSDLSIMPANEFASQLVQRENSTVHNVITGVEAEDGNIVWTSVTAVPVNFSDWRTIIVTADITEAKIAGEALRVNEKRFRSYFELPLTGRCITSQQKGWIDVNQTLCDMLGYTKQELVALSWTELTYPEDLAADLEQFNKVVSGEIEGYSLDKRFIQKNGELVYTHLAVHCLRNPDNSVNYFVAIILDITDRKKAEEEISLINKELSALNAEKDKFFSIIAHDLRGPFNGFLGLFQYMEEELPSMRLDEIQHITQTMRKSAKNLYRLIENLLDWSRLARGVIDFTPVQFLLLPKLSEMMMTVMPTAEKKEIVVNLSIPGDLTVMADEYMFAGIIRNLTSNAVKFTPKGGTIEISAKIHHDNAILFSIKDSGIGMSKKIMNTLFTLNDQVNRHGTEGEASTGLGLIICRDFVEKHGGRLWVESEEEKGSTFYFTLPITFTSVSNSMPNF